MCIRNDMSYCDSAMKLSRTPGLVVAERGINDRCPTYSEGCTVVRANGFVPDGIAPAYTASVSVTTRCKSNALSTSLRPFRPSLSASERSVTNPTIAVARLATSPGLTNLPLIPSTHTSRHPGTSVAISGLAIEAASTKTRGTPSRYFDASTTSVDWFKRPTISLQWPTYSTTPSSCQPLITDSGMAAGCSESCQPASKKRADTPSRRNTLAAATYSPIPLSHNRRAAQSTMGTPFGRGEGGKARVSTPEPRMTAV